MTPRDEQHDLLIRLELRDEIEQRLSRQYEKLIEGFKQEIAQLTSAREGDQKAQTDSQELLKQIASLKENELILNRQITEREGMIASLKHKLNVSQEKNREMKTELDGLKKLNPLATKKKLEEKKREVREKNEAITQLKAGINKQRQEKRILSQSLGTLKDRIERLQRQPEASSASSLYTSKCQNFRVFSAEFESEIRPFIGNDVNYRVLDTRDGSSLVAYRSEENGEVAFATPQMIPEDVKDYIQTSITFADEEESDMV